MMIFQDPFLATFVSRLPVCTTCCHLCHQDTHVISRLRASTSLPWPSSRTKKYCSFINYYLNRYECTKPWLTFIALYMRSQHLRFF